ncbi:hypothetical protein C9374_005947 [Naegleria lovaniensis]|uniref:Uncharacterized protein n=1 Tax=Naegleria lovaniensis TaxID=51637 RepID=A0AA88GN07_NAELO|nr:uncharacterized protein C9374_005947 [Naegleria lovaniensis]KAG2381563.1 hypothetical protein C9374_005947 [Naegleria lovaniensis]
MLFVMNHHQHHHQESTPLNLHDYSSSASQHDDSSQQTFSSTSDLHASPKRTVSPRQQQPQPHKRSTSKSLDTSPPSSSGVHKTYKMSNALTASPQLVKNTSQQQLSMDLASATPHAPDDKFSRPLLKNETVLCEKNPNFKENYFVFEKKKEKTPLAFYNISVNDILSGGVKSIGNMSATATQQNSQKQKKKNKLNQAAQQHVFVLNNSSPTASSLKGRRTHSSKHSSSSGHSSSSSSSSNELDSPTEISTNTTAPTSSHPMFHVGSVVTPQFVPFSNPHVMQANSQHVFNTQNFSGNVLNVQPPLNAVSMTPNVFIPSTPSTCLMSNASHIQQNVTNSQNSLLQNALVLQHNHASSSSMNGMDNLMTQLDQSLRQQLAQNGLQQDAAVSIWQQPTHQEYNIYPSNISPSSSVTCQPTFTLNSTPIISSQSSPFIVMNSFQSPMNNNNIFMNSPSSHRNPSSSTNARITINVNNFSTPSTTSSITHRLESDLKESSKEDDSPISSVMSQLLEVTMKQQQQNFALAPQETTNLLRN